MHIRKTLEPCKTERRARTTPRARGRSPAPTAATFAASLSVGALSTALAGPTGGVVVEGQGSISNPSAASTVIDQASQRLQLNWSSFNVAANESVQFNQPSSTALALNRILDQNPSQIFGSLKANGQVVLINPNGLLIGRTAQLNVNSLVASSLDAIDFDAASGRYRFSTSRNDIGAVINEGSITAGPGGSVTLLGGRVSNSGSIVADFGTVNLAAGRAATLDLAGDGLLRLELGSAAVENSGTIQANGGQVLLTANAVQGVFTNLVNNTGVVRANRIDNTGGIIRLVGPEGTVESSGTLDASAGDALSTGGSVEVLGDRVGLLGSAVVDVSGAARGGTALIGGDYQGSNANVLNASYTYVGSGVTLKADGGLHGDGGRIIVWSNEGTRYLGHLSARGGSLSGNGGFAEVSGKQALLFRGTADLSSAFGNAGTLLLDPDHLTITAGTDDDGSGTYTYGSLPEPASIGDQTIEGLLLSGNVTLQAEVSLSSVAGSNVNVTGNTGHFLELDSHGTISLAGDISLNNGEIRLMARNPGDGSGGITLTPTASLVTGGGADITLDAGTGGIDMQNSAPNFAQIGTNAGITFTSDGSIGVTQLNAGGTVNLHAATSIANDGDTGTSIVANNLTLQTDGGAIGASGAGNAIDTSIGNQLTALAVGGSIYVKEQNGVTLQNLSALSGGAVISVTGGQSGTAFTVRDVHADGDVTLDTQGNILGLNAGNGVDSDNGDISLHAGGVIGSVTGSAFPVRIADANQLSAIADLSSGGVINLRLPAAPISVLNGGIRLGSGGGRSGEIRLQSTGALTLSAFANGAIDVGGGSNVLVNLDAVGTLTLPSAASIIGQPAGTWRLKGTDIVDTGDGTPHSLTLAAQKIDFQATNPTGDKVLTTTTGQLDLSFGVARDLDVTNTGTLTLNSIATAGGNATITSNGTITLGTITAGGGNVTVTSTGGGIFDDGDPVTTTTVAGNTVKLTGASVGLPGSFIDTDAAILDLSAPNSSIFVRENDGVQVQRATALDDVDVETIDGAMTVTGSGVSSGNTVRLATGGVGPPRNLAINAGVNGGASVDLTAGPANSNISFSAPISSSGTVTMTAGTPGNFGTLTTTGGGVSGGTLDMKGSAIGQAPARIQTSAGTLITNSSAGDTYITETDDVAVNGTATGLLDVRTVNGAIVVNHAAGSGVQLTTNGVGKSIVVNGAVTGGGAGVQLTTVDPNSSIAVNDTIDAPGAIALVTGQNGNIAVDDDITSTSNIVTLTAGSPGNRGTLTAGSGAVVSGSSVNATARSIGAVGARFTSSTNTLNATTEAGDIFAQEVGATTLNATATGGQVDVATTDGLLNVTSASGTGVTLVTNGTSRNINVNGLINGNGAAVVLNATGAIAGSGQVQGSSLTASGTSIGSSGTRLATTVGSLTTTSTGNVGTFITETDGVTLNGTATGGGPLDVRTTDGTLTVSSAAGNGVTLNAGGANRALTLNGAVNGGSGAVDLRASGDNGSIDLKNAITTSGAVTVTAGSVAARGAINLDPAHSIAAGALTVTGLSIGTAGTRLKTTATSLNATSTSGDLYVQETDGLTSLTASATGAVDVIAGGAVTVASAIGNGVALTTGGGGNLTLNGAVNGAAAAVTLNASGAIVSGGGTVTGGSLTATGTSIGTSGARLATNVGTLNTTSTGGVGTFITEQDGVTLTASAVGGGTLDVRTTNGSLVENAAAGNGVTLIAGGAGNTLTLNGAVVGGSGAVSLSASGAGGNIDLKNAVSSTGPVSVTAGTLASRGLFNVDPASSISGGAVTVAGQSIGTNATRLKTTATSLDATSTNGDLYVQETDGLTTLTANATGIVDVAAGGAMGVAAANGSAIALATSAGDLGIIGAVSAGPAGAVVLNAGAAITAGGGNSITGNSLTATGTAIGTGASRLVTNVATLNTTSTGPGGTFVTETNGVTLTGSATGGGGLDVETINGSLDTTTIAGNGIRLVAGGAGNSLTVNSAVAGGNGNVMLAATGDGGNVTVGGSVSTTGDVTIAAGSVADRGILALGGGTVSGDDVVVAAESIGTSGGPLLTSATSLNATSSNGGIFVRETDGLALTANATGGTVAVETLNGALTVAGAIGNGVTLTTAGAGNGITINGAVNGGGSNVTLNAQGDGAAIALNSAVSTTADVLLSAGSASSRGAISAGAGNQVNASGLVIAGASIGAAGARLNTAASAMDLTSTAGGAFVSEADALTLTANATGGALDVQTANGTLAVNAATGDGVTLSAGGAANDLTINGPVSGGVGNVALTAAGAGGAIHLDAPVSTTGNVTLTAGTAGNRGAIVAGAGEQITANALTATGASLGTSSSRLATTVSSLNATSTNGGAFVTESDGLSLNASVTGGALDVRTTNGALIVAAASGNGVSLVTNGDGNDLSVTGPVSGGASDVTLTANGAGSNLRLAGLVSTTANVALTAGTSASRGAIITDGGNTVAANALTAVGASIGTSSFALNTTVTSVDATATAGNIRIIETDDLALTAHATGGALEVQTLGSSIDVASASAEGINLTASGNGTLTVNGPMNAGGGEVLLTSGGAMTFNGDVTSTNGMILNTGAGSDVTLNAALTGANITINAGSVSNRGDLIAGAGSHITADQLILTTASVGTSGARLGTTANSIDARTSNGGIYVDETDALDLTATATGGTVDVRTADGALTAVSVVGDGVTLATGGNGHALTLNAGNLSSGVQGRAGPVSLTTGGAGSDIVLNDAVQTTSGVVIAANGDGSNVTLNSVIGSAGNVSITAGSAASRGAITVGDPAANIASDSVTLVGASVGASNARVNTAVATLNATSTNGAIYLNELDGVALTANATGGALDVNAGGPITVASASGNGVTLATTAPSGDITVNSALNAGTGAVSLLATGPASDIALNAALTAAGNVTLVSGNNGNVALNAPVSTSSGDVTVTSGGNIALSNSLGAAGNVTLATSANGTIDLNGAVSATAGNVTVSSGGGIALNSSLTANAGNVAMTTGAGGALALNGSVVAGSGSVALTAGTTANRGAITVGTGVSVTAASLTAVGSAIGTSANRLNTTVATLDTTSTNGGTYVTESDGLALTASATGGALDVQTTNGALTVASATGAGVSLAANGNGNDLKINGPVSGGANDVTLLAAGASGNIRIAGLVGTTANVTLTAGTVASRGAITGTAGGRVSGATLTALASSIGSGSSPLNTAIDALTANATSGDVAISEQNGLRLTDVRAGGNVSVTSATGDIAVVAVNAANNATLTASAGAISDDGDDTTRLLARDVTLLARSIGAPSTLTGTVLDSKPRLDISATTLDATSTGGGIFIDELDGLTGISARATGGAAGDIEILSAAGDLNLQSISASDTLLLAAGRDIIGLPGLGSISARAAELRAGGADSTAGHIGALTQPLTLQLAAGNTLRLFVPQTVNPKDASRAPATLPSSGVLTTLSLFGSPSALSVQAGFGQFTGNSDSQFTSPAESLVRTIQNQTAIVQSVVGLDWASFDPNVSLFGTLDPAVCLPSDQRDEEKGDTGC